MEYIPSREVSYEELLEMGWEFASLDELVEDKLVKAQLMDKLEEVLHSLSDEEMALI